MSQPNILVITCDDLSLSTVQAGLDAGLLPNISLVRDLGTELSCYAVDSVCCPSRATFLTGQHSHNHGVRANVPPLGGVANFNASATLATALQAAGYRTGLVGKYLNGYAPAGGPIPPGWESWQVTLSGQMYNWNLQDGSQVVSYGSTVDDYQTDVLAERAVDFVAYPDQRPWFLWFCPGAPHEVAGTVQCTDAGALRQAIPAIRHIGAASALPLPVPANLNEIQVSDKPSWLKNGWPLLTAQQLACFQLAHQRRVESLMAVDDALGALLAALPANTQVVFTSDNGFDIGEHRLSGKEFPYQETLRVPLYMTGAGIPAATSITSLVANLDLCPTILEWAGASAPVAQDGLSIVPLLSGGPWRSALLFEHMDGAVPNYSAIVTATHKLVRYIGSSDRELYDLALDPYELTSKHADPAYAAIKALLESQLQALRTCSGPSCWM